MLIKTKSESELIEHSNMLICKRRHSSWQSFIVIEKLYQDFEISEVERVNIKMFDIYSMLLFSLTVCRKLSNIISFFCADLQIFHDEHAQLTKGKQLLQGEALQVIFHLQLDRLWEILNLLLKLFCFILSDCLKFLRNECANCAQNWVSVCCFYLICCFSVWCKNQKWFSICQWSWLIRKDKIRQFSSLTCKQNYNIIQLSIICLFCILAWIFFFLWQ